MMLCKAVQWSALRGQAAHRVVACKHLWQGVQQGVHHCPAAFQIDQEFVWQGQEGLLYVCNHLYTQHPKFSIHASHSNT